MAAMMRMDQSTLNTVAAWYRIYRVFILLLASCFLFQVFSPLRLNSDAIVLLSMADSAANGHGFRDNEQTTVFPPGYPALLAVLMRTGLAHSWMIIFLNMVFLTLGLFAAYDVIRREFFADGRLALLLCSVSLLSFVVIKHFTIPLTDVPFFCYVMSCLAVISRVREMPLNGRLALYLIWALAISVVAITNRRMGVALLPSIAWLMMSDVRFKLSHRRAYIHGIATAILVIIATGFIWLVLKTSTLRDFPSSTVGIASQARKIVTYRFTELGELALNLPMSKMPQGIHAVVPWIGFVLLLTVLLGVVKKLSDGIRPTEIFLLAYAGILFAWPYYDTRFWLPVTPLLASYSAVTIQRSRLLSKAVILGYVLFAALGVTAIAYTSRITFAGSRFPDVYGDGTLRPTYCAAFRSCPNDPDPKKVDMKALRLLQLYN
jgi:hypothetical protein